MTCLCNYYLHQWREVKVTAGLISGQAFKTRITLFGSCSYGDWMHLLKECDFFNSHCTNSHLHFTMNRIYCLWASNEWAMRNSKQNIWGGLEPNRRYNVCREEVIQLASHTEPIGAFNVRWVDLTETPEISLISSTCHMESTSCVCVCVFDSCHLPCADNMYLLSCHLQSSEAAEVGATETTNLRSKFQHLWVLLCVCTQKKTK